MSELKYCRDVVARISKKHQCSPVWLWDVLEERYNMIKGLGCLMTAEEIEDFDGIIGKYVTEDRGQEVAE